MIIIIFYWVSPFQIVDSKFRIYLQQSLIVSAPWIKQQKEFKDSWCTKREIVIQEQMKTTPFL
jgi:hypothetical protein